MAHFDLNSVGSPVASSSPTSNRSNRCHNTPKTLQDFFDHTRSMMEKDLENRLEIFEHLKKEGLKEIKPVEDLIYCDIDQRENTKISHVLDVFKVFSPCASELGLSGPIHISPSSSSTSIDNAWETAAQSLNTESVDIQKKNSKVRSSNVRNYKKKTSALCKDKTCNSMRPSRTMSQRMFTQTPKGKIPFSNKLATVTPGPNLQTPSRIYRKPVDGESVISLSGSPILVTTNSVSSKVPQMHIPLKDGRVYAVLAQDGLEDANFPEVDSETLCKIKKLHEFIGEQILGK